MKFKQLKIQNFGSIHEATIDLSGRGLTLITGVNQDTSKASSNGAGKSLILDAICWTLWGRTPRGQEDDAVVNRFIGKNCLVELSLEEAASQFLIRRHRLDAEHTKPNDIELLIDGVPSSGNSMSATQAKINDVLGLDFETFCAMMVGAHYKIAGMTDAKVKALLERLLQTEVLAEAQELVKEELKELKTSQATASANITMLYSTLQNLEKQMAQYCAGEASFIKTQEAAFQKLETRLTELLAQQKENTDLAARCAFQEEMAEDFAKKLADKYQESKSLRQEMNSRLEPIMFSGNLLKEQRVVQEAKQQELSDLAKLVDKECPTCMQHVSKELWEATGGQELSHVKKRLAELTGLILSNEEEYIRTLESYGDKTDEVEQEINWLNREIKAARAQALPGTVWLRQQATLLQKQLEDVTEALKEDVVSPFKSLIKNTSTAAYDAAAKYAREIKSLNKQNLRIAQLTFWQEGFSTQGIRSYMLEHVVPVLNERAAHYAQILTDGEMHVVFSTKTELKSKETREKFRIQVQEKHGADSYVGSSAGERARADLVVAMAIGDLATLRTKKQLPFRFLDEPFESIDESGTDAIVKLLDDQRDKFDTIFVVTHNDAFKQLFSQHLIVTKKSGVTKVQDE